MNHIALLFALPHLALAQSVAPLLEHKILDPTQPELEVRASAASHVLPTPYYTNIPEWEKYARNLREDILNKVILRGEAKRWAEASTKVEWLDTIPGGAGYRIKKFRFEAIPGLWVPGLLYEPENLSGKVPAVVNVKGHEGTGADTPYIQVRCINLAKHRILAYNIDWMGTGHLPTPGFAHPKIQQIDLTPTPPLA